MNRRYHKLFCVFALAAVTLAALLYYPPLAGGTQPVCGELLLSGTLADGKLNVNTATAEQLQLLPGIGAEKAHAIVEHREEQGAFASIEALMQVQGIGSAIFEDIKTEICV